MNYIFFIHIYFKEQINIKEQVPKYLVAEVKLLTTKCVLIETEKIAKKALGALTILKQFGIHQCGHRDPISGADCLLSMIGSDNKTHYIVATQDRDLQHTLRSIPGTPLIYLHKKAPTLEKPSPASCEAAKCKQDDLLGTISTIQEKTLKSLKEKSGFQTDETLKIKKKKKRGGPNPLSCLKKKKKSKQSAKPVPTEKASGRVRKRKRVKLPSHIKQTLKQTM